MRVFGSAAALALVLVGLGGRPASAWSFDLHRLITDRAIDLLPAGLRPFYEARRALVVEHAVDPDLWRTAGWTAEPPRHFLNLDAYGPPPFERLPRDRDEALQKNGIATIEQFGTLPWRAEEMHGKLTDAFARLPSRGGHAATDVAFFSAVLSHYVADAHQPFHAALNYDGQLTGQRGIHSRFEDELYDRFAGSIALAPAAPRARADALDLVFEALVSGFALVEPVLDADRAAAAAAGGYDEVYFTAFFREVEPLVERRLSEAVTSVAALWAGAWEAAGRPTLPAEPTGAPRAGRPGGGLHP